MIIPEVASIIAEVTYKRVTDKHDVEEAARRLVGKVDVIDAVILVVSEMLIDIVRAKCEGREYIDLAYSYPILWVDSSETSVIYDVLMGRVDRFMYTEWFKRHIVGKIITLSSKMANILRYCFKMSNDSVGYKSDAKSLATSILELSTSSVHDARLYMIKGDLMASGVPFPRYSEINLGDTILWVYDAITILFRYWPIRLLAWDHNLLSNIESELKLVLRAPMRGSYSAGGMSIIIEEQFNYNIKLRAAYVTRNQGWYIWYGVEAIPPQIEAKYFNVRVDVR